MFNKLLALISTSLTVIFLQIVFSANPLQARALASDLPDLKVRQYQFVPNNDKALRVQVANFGKSASSPCSLELIIRKIAGVTAARKVSATIPTIGVGKVEWIFVNASAILPQAINLKDTTFRLVVDATKLVAESDESNNTIWHNLAVSAGSNNVPVISDATITEKIKATLAQDQELAAFNIHVDTNEGVVTLQGSVATDEARTRAEKSAQDTDGVKKVINLLKIKTAAPSDTSDVAITAKIKAKLAADQTVAPFHLNVVVGTSEGIVTLQGRVSKEAVRTRAEQLSSETKGVKKVINLIKVGN